jgi:L-asparaginase II
MELATLIVGLIGGLAKAGADAIAAYGAKGSAEALKILDEALRDGTHTVARMRDQLEQNDKAADEALAKKFPVDEAGGRMP